MSGSELLSIVAALGCDFGIERSVKLSRNHINQDRYLLSIHKDDIGSDTDAAFHALMSSVGVPPSRRAMMADNLAAADIIHLAHEGGPNPVRKIYLEFSSAVSAAPGAQLVHLALKWSAAADGMLSRYWHDPRKQPGDVLEHPATAPSHLAARAFLDIAQRRAGDIMMLEVEEEESPRRSLDFNLYPAGLVGQDIAAPLDDLLSAYEIEAVQGAKLQSALAPQKIGHLSIGTGRDGTDFTTIYFGVEPGSRNGHG